jgi:phosphoribosylanthranilate isomerase
MSARRTRVKICGVREVSHALAAANSGADAIGLNFWPGTPRMIDPTRAREIRAALPPFVSVVGVFVDPSADDVRAALAAVALDALQFHGHESPALCRSFGRPYIKALAVGDGVAQAALVEYAARYPDAAALLFDAPPERGLPGGTGRAFDWSALPDTLTRPLVVSGGLTAANVGDAIRRVRPWAVDVSSGVEAIGADGEAVKGVKDPARIAAFIEAVRNADA